MMKNLPKAPLILFSLLHLSNSFAEALTQKEPYPHISEGTWATFAVCAKFEANCDTPVSLQLDGYDIAYTGEKNSIVTTYIRLYLSEKGKAFLKLTEQAFAEERLVSFLSCDKRELFSWQVMDRSKNSDVVTIQLDSVLENVLGPLDILNCKTT